MRVTLEPHPDSSAPAIRVAAQADRPQAGRLVLHFTVDGDVGGVLLPEPAPPAAVDGLWRHTCFEAFLGTPGHADYLELNFSPSGQWAAYRFGGYRSGMSTLGHQLLPELETCRSADRYELAAALDLCADRSPLAGQPWRLGLAAVVEARDGSRSYWALAHPRGEPDFHHADCFALELPPPKPA